MADALRDMTDPSPDLTISQVTQVTEELYKACLRLIPQLTSHNPPPSRQELALLISSPSSILFMAQHLNFDTEIIGLACVVIYRVPTGVRAYIEDVIVDENARGRGVGEALMQACLERAEHAGASQVMLTSNPNRQAANRLYQRMGFEQRNTNVYRFRLKRGSNR
jgi:ribosomal protein S18 acetylase RimI-like enzyme